MPNFKPKMLFANGNESGLNGLVFESPSEALDYGSELLSRWMLPIGRTIVETEDPVNSRWVDGKLVMLEKAVS